MFWLAGRWERRFARLSGGPPEWEESLSILQFTDRHAPVAAPNSPWTLPAAKGAAWLRPLGYGAEY